MMSSFFGGSQAKKAAAQLHPLHGEEVAPQKSRSSDAQLEIFLRALDAIPCNAMFCDRELTLTFLNKHSLKTLRTLQQYLPMPVDKLVGNSIHIFHKNTANVDRILGAKHHAGKHSLPHNAVIQLGPEKLDLEIEPMLDEHGQFLGAVVMWGITTQKMEAMEQAQRILALGVSEINEQLAQVSTASHEIDASISEIAMNAVSTERSAQQSKQAVDNGLSAIHHLQGSSKGVSNVAQLIASIATQTGVLALNASIEAARAGVHGKGFSVVAAEVKKLAEQTASATADIQNKVKTIESDLGTTVQAIDGIAKQTDEMLNLSQILASAAEEQRAATNEMAQSLERASARTAEIADMRLRTGRH